MILDGFYNRHLTKWIVDHVREGEQGDALEKIQCFFRHLDDEDARHWLDRGWREIYDYVFLNRKQTLVNENE